MEERIEELHKVSFKGLYNLFLERRQKYKWYFYVSFVFSLFVFGWLLSKQNGYNLDFLKNIVDLTLSFFPNLLGFSLGGFAIVVGFSNTELIKKSARFNSYSIYQILNGNFCIVILLQILITALAFLIKLFIQFNIKVDMPESIVVLFNAIPSLFLTFLALIILMLTPIIAINLFTLSQVNNMFFTASKYAEKEKKDSRQEPES